MRALQFGQSAEVIRLVSASESLRFPRMLTCSLEQYACVEQYADYHVSCFALVQWQ